MRKVIIISKRKRRFLEIISDSYAHPRFQISIISSESKLELFLGLLSKPSYVRSIKQQNYRPTLALILEPFFRNIKFKM